MVCSMAAEYVPVSMLAGYLLYTEAWHGLLRPYQIYSEWEFFFCQDNVFSCLGEMLSPQRGILIVLCSGVAVTLWAFCFLVG